MILYIYIYIYIYLYVLQERLIINLINNCCNCEFGIVQYYNIERKTYL